MTGQLQTTDQIAQMLSNYVGAPVVNNTGLTARYDFNLELAESDPNVPDNSLEHTVSVFAAVQDYLGLKLEKTKGPVEVFVIDHVEQVPTGN
jgi:uncharacterized protein (TIGR03435 family)